MIRRSDAAAAAAAKSYLGSHFPPLTEDSRKNPETPSPAPAAERALLSPMSTILIAISAYLLLFHTSAIRSIL